VIQLGKNKFHDTGSGENRFWNLNFKVPICPGRKPASKTRGSSANSKRTTEDSADSVTF
jgi:hypothetical protein